jgi:hypothetical protein
MKTENQNNLQLKFNAARAKQSAYTLEQERIKKVVQKLVALGANKTIAFSLAKYPNQ